MAYWRQYIFSFSCVVACFVHGSMTTHAGCPEFRNLSGSAFDAKAFVRDLPIVDPARSPADLYAKLFSRLSRVNWASEGPYQIVWAPSIPSGRYVGQLEKIPAPYERLFQFDSEFRENLMQLGLLHSDYSWNSGVSISSIVQRFRRATGMKVIVGSEFYQDGFFMDDLSFASTLADNAIPLDDAHDLFHMIYLMNPAYRLWTRMAAMAYADFGVDAGVIVIEGIFEGSLPIPGDIVRGPLLLLLNVGDDHPEEVRRTIPQMQGHVDERQTWFQGLGFLKVEAERRRREMEPSRMFRWLGRKKRVELDRFIVQLRTELDQLISELGFSDSGL